MKQTKIQLSLFVMLLFFFQTRCDIPVHCVKSQIEGQWQIFATKAQTRNDLYKFTCGHSLPSKEGNAFTVVPNRSFNIQYTVDLQASDSALLSINGGIRVRIIFIKKGKWTMVYNEGFDILIGNMSFFAFSKYALNRRQNPDITTKWVSKCYSTLVGWYHIGPKKWGCFYATKVGENPEEITNGEPKGKLLVVANTVQKLDSDRKNRFKSINKKKKLNNIVSSPNTQINKDLLNQDDTNTVLENLMDGPLTNFMQMKETMFLSREFKDHHKFINRVKNLTDLWEAGTYDEFSKMTLEELNNFAGRKKIGNPFVKKDLDLNKIFKQKYPRIDKKNSADMFKFRSIKRKSTHRDLKFPEFPRNYFQEKKYMFNARNQGSCGSCYAMATISMLEARVRRMTGNQIKEKLSVQHVLDCSVYNQGCNGGYAYLVLKFGSEVELVPESCMKYQGRDSGCENRCDRNTLERTYHVKNYRYLGGSYGKCSEYEIMKEVLQNGPIVVSFEPDYMFMHYKRGIYKSIGNTWLTRGEPKPQWVKVDHSVTLVGWGYDEEKQVPYWILQNSWGKHWGEGGYFRMIRGIDHMGIESICEAGTPIIRSLNNNR